MQTIYDWVTVAAFASLIVLFLHRSSHDEPPDHLWQYLPPAIGCAVANYCGNHGWDIAAIAVLVATAAYVFYVLKPRFSR